MQSDRDLKQLKNDVRLQEWAVRNGLMKKEDVEAMRKELPDVAGNASPIDLEEKRH